MKTLIVEDDFTSRLLLQRILAPYGECHIAVNGKEALAAFRAAIDARSPYQLVCLDIVLPELDGQAVLKAIRAAEADVGNPPGVGARIIMTTSVQDPVHVVGAFKQFCDAYLTKPIDVRKLREHLRSFGLCD